jgi:hypothetical protein
VQCAPPRRAALRVRCRNVRQNLAFEKLYDLLRGLPQAASLAALLVTALLYFAFGRSGVGGLELPVTRIQMWKSCTTTCSLFIF